MKIVLALLFVVLMGCVSSPDTGSPSAYHCEWSWPQKILAADNSVVKECTEAAGYCNKLEAAEGKAVCCGECGGEPYSCSGCEGQEPIVEDVVPGQAAAPTATAVPTAMPTATPAPKKNLIPPASEFSLVSARYFKEYDEDMIFCNYNEVARYDDTSDIFNTVPYVITDYECADAAEAREMYDDHAEFYDYDKKSPTDYGDHGVESFDWTLKSVDFVTGNYFVKIGGGTLEKSGSEALVREITESVIARLAE